MEELETEPLYKKIKEISEKGFLYVPDIKPIPNTIHDKLLVGGKAYIEDIWIYVQTIKIEFKDIPTLIFEFHTIENLQERLKENYGEKEAHYEQ